MVLLKSMKEHGGDIYALAETLRLPERKIIDFSASINPLGVSKKIKAEIRRYLKLLYHYPDPNCRRFKRHIARYDGIDETRIICGNGSTELIYLIARAIKPKKVLIPAPTFSEYERAVRISSEDCQIDYLLLRKDNNFGIIPEEFIRYMDGCDMAFLCNPNNPTAQVLTREEVLRIAEAAMQQGCYLIVDEAFIDFIPEHSVIPLIHNNPFVVVLRSMTKFYALSGLRLGYGLFPENLMETLLRFKEPWTVNSLAQRAGVVALKDKAYRKRSLEYIKQEKSFLEKGLKRLSIEFLPSMINFYLLMDPRAEEIYEHMKRKGILLRRCSNFVGLGKDYLRIAVRTHRENALFLKELKAFLTENK